MKKWCINAFHLLGRHLQIIKIDHACEPFIFPYNQVLKFDMVNFEQFDSFFCDWDMPNLPYFQSKSLERLKIWISLDRKDKGSSAWVLQHLRTWLTLFSNWVLPLVGRCDWCQDTRQQRHTKSNTTHCSRHVEPKTVTGRLNSGCPGQSHQTRRRASPRHLLRLSSRAWAIQRVESWVFWGCPETNC